MAAQIPPAGTGMPSLVQVADNGLQLPKQFTKSVLHPAVAGRSVPPGAQHSS